MFGGLKLAFFLHLLSLLSLSFWRSLIHLQPESYSITGSQHHHLHHPSLPGSPQSPHHTNKIKVARITPRPYPDVTITAGLSSSRSPTASSSSSNNLITNSPGSTSSSSNGSGPVLPICVASNGNLQNQLLPNVTLSAVTPSSIKSIHPHASLQVRFWGMGG